MRCFRVQLFCHAIWHEMYFFQDKCWYGIKKSCNISGKKHISSRGVRCNREWFFSVKYLASFGTLESKYLISKTEYKCNLVECLASSFKFILVGDAFWKSFKMQLLTMRFDLNCFCQLQLCISKSVRTLFPDKCCYWKEKLHGTAN